MFGSLSSPRTNFANRTRSPAAVHRVAASAARPHAAQIMDVQIMSRALSLSNAVRSRTVEDEAEATQELLGGDGTLATKQRARLGKLYTWGSGDYGRLGHGDNHSQKQPKLVEILREKDVRKFACGSRHVLALGSDGAVYSWGFGGDGQLGHGDLGIQTNPRLVKALHSEGVRDVCCGENHSVALTSGGDVFTWGEGAHGQLGLGDFRKQHTPRRVMELEGKMIVQITAGAYHTACIAEDHSVYCWGQGQSGRLGLGDEANTPTPTLVEGLTGCGIETVRAFGEHTMALTLPLETGAATDFDPRSRERMQQKVKELEVRNSAAPFGRAIRRNFLTASSPRPSQVKLKQEKMAAHDAKEARNASRSKLVESEQNVDRLKRQNEALLQERVELYMKMQAGRASRPHPTPQRSHPLTAILLPRLQNLDNQLSVVTAEKDNLDHELMSLVAMPTKLAEITAQGVRQIACGLHHVLALSDAGDVYAWGGGGAGQLGLGRRKSFPAPQLVWGMMRKGVRQIGAGSKHSAALTYASGRVSGTAHGRRLLLTPPIPPPATGTTASSTRGGRRRTGSSATATSAPNCSPSCARRSRPSAASARRRRGCSAAARSTRSPCWATARCTCGAAPTSASSGGRSRTRRPSRS